MRDLMEAICDKDNVYIWILHCGNENYEEKHKLKSAREFDDCLAAVITLDFYSIRLFVDGVEQYADKFDVQEGFLKYYFRVSFDKETKAVKVRMYARVDESLRNSWCGPKSDKLICRYKYIGNYNYYDTNVVIGISAICNDPYLINERDLYPDPVTDDFIDTFKKNPDSYSKLQDDLIKGLEFQSRPTREAYEANHGVLTSEVGKIKFIRKGYDKSSKITLKNDYFCPLIVNPLNIERIYTYAYNIYYAIGFDRDNNMIIDNMFRDEFVDVDDIVRRCNDENERENARREINHIRMLIQDEDKPLEVIKFGLYRFHNKVDASGNTYYTFGKKSSEVNSLPCIISKEDGGSFSKMTKNQYEELINSPYMNYIDRTIEETMSKHHIPLLQLEEFLKFDATKSFYEENDNQIENEVREENEDDTDDDVNEEDLNEDDGIETDELLSESTSKRRVRVSTDKIAFTRQDIITCVEYDPNIDPYDNEEAWRTMLVVYLNEVVTINAYRVFNVFRVLHDYRDEPLLHETTLLEQHADKYFKCVNEEVSSKNTAAQLLTYVRSCKKGRILYYAYFLTYKAMLLEDEERATVISLLNDIRQHWNEMVVNTSGITITDNKKENGEGNKPFNKDGQNNRPYNKDGQNNS
jgi:hypothetical protein